MDIKKVSIGDKFPTEFNVLIEIGAGISSVKYEFDKDSGALFVDRFLSTAMFYPWNYGFVPHTQAKDGDPLDVLVITGSSLVSGCVVQCRAIGALQMWDEKGEDFKVIAVPIDSVSLEFKNIHSCSDLPEISLEKIKHFFSHYKDLEKGKEVKIGSWLDVSATEEFMKSAVL